MRRLPGFLAAVAVVSMLLSITGCKSKPNDPLAEIRQRGILVVAVWADETGSNHDVRSLEKQVAQELAEGLQVAVRYEAMAEDQLVAAVNDKKVDVAAGILLPWDQQSEDFSLIYGRRGVFIAAEENRTITSLRDLAGSSLGISGTVGSSIRQQLAPIDELVINEYDSLDQVKLDIQNDIIAGYICYEEEAAQLLGEDQIAVRDCPDIRVESYAFTAGSKQPELLGQLNQILTGVLGRGR